MLARKFFRGRLEEAVTKRAIFQFIHEAKNEVGFSVASACRTIGVSETGYYKFRYAPLERSRRNEHKPRRWQHTLDKMHEVLKELRRMIFFPTRGKSSNMTYTSIMSDCHYPS